MPTTTATTASLTSFVPSAHMEDDVTSFNENDHELYRQHIPNNQSLEWMRQNVPVFECPDREIERTYHFRWWTFRKHIKETPDGFIVTEFLPPVKWAGKHNSISCPAGHHFREGRWLAENRVLRDYSLFWLHKGGSPRNYSFWIADSIMANALVNGDLKLPIALLPDLIANYEAWEHAHRDSCGLYWQRDDRDGMELSISGKLAPQERGYRATINSYMFGDAIAIATIAKWANLRVVTEKFLEKAAEIKRLTQEHLWDPNAKFFKVLPRVDNPRLSDVRELHGYTPWYFHLPDKDKSDAWKQLMDRQGFYAPFGPTTAEQRHPDFSISDQGHHCQWNGPSWPFSTSVTLTAMANLLHNYHQKAVSRNDYFEILRLYTKSHRLKLDDGRVVPWIDENINPFTGDWIARSRKKTWRDGAADPAKGEERGKDYNHSTYCDLIITGIVGLQPRADDIVKINPLAPKSWDFFCLDHVRYHDRWLTILFDKTGQRYQKGKGLRVFVDGKEVAMAPSLSRISGILA